MSAAVILLIQTAMRGLIDSGLVMARLRAVRGVALLGVLFTVLFPGAHNYAEQPAQEHKSDDKNNNIHASTMRLDAIGIKPVRAGDTSGQVVV